MKRFRMTKSSKILLVILLVIGLGIGGFFAYSNGLIKIDKKGNNSSSQSSSMITADNSNSSKQTEASKENSTTELDDVINLSLDEWIAWKPIIDANGGTKTTPDSIFGKMGLDVNINIINDATQSSNALINGNLNASGYTINRTAFLSQKFKDNNVEVIMPTVTNFSSGGDGLIAKTSIKSVEDLVGAKIGVPRFSEAQTLVVWFVNSSDLEQAKKDEIIKNLILFDTPDDTAKAFFAGQIDVAATWQPYLSQAQESTDSHILFDTKTSTKLIMDGILFRKDFAEKYPETVTKFIDGVIQAESMYETEFEYIKKTMPLFSTESDENIIAMCGNAGLTGYKNNLDILKSDGVSIYKDMCDVWESIGEKVDRDLVNTLFDVSYIEKLSDKYASVIVESKKPEITEEAKSAVKDTEALLTKTSTINFMPDTAKFLDSAEATKILDEFIKIAKILDGTIIQIEGNINASNFTEEGMKLSEERAKSVAKYFISNGIDSNRIMIIGNGNKKMIGDINTEEGKIKNRRTDIFFKTIEE